MPCSHCSNPKVLARGLCQPCYHRLRRNGSVERKYVIRVPVCIVPGCEREAGARNLCETHYNKADHPLKTTWKLLRSRWPGQYPVRWDDFSGFLEDVGERPSDRCQLRRADHAKPWSKNNIRWVERIAGGKKDSMTPQERAAYAREWKLQRKFGISTQDYDAAFSEQGGGCAICGVKPTRQRLHVDHCHDKKHVRGLLCTNCNRGIGYFHDVPERLRRAAEYLERAK